MRLIDMINQQKKSTPAATEVQQPAPVPPPKPAVESAQPESTAPKKSLIQFAKPSPKPVQTEETHPVPVVQQPALNQKLGGISLPSVPEAIGDMSNMTLQDHINALNAYAESELGINMLTMDKCRRHVSEIMQTLRTQPELDSCLLDRDVRNVIQVVYRLREDATYVIEKTKAKVEKRAAKTKAGGVDFDEISAALPSFGGTLTPASITDLSKMKG